MLLAAHYDSKEDIRVTIAKNERGWGYEEKEEVPSYTMSFITSLCSVSLLVAFVYFFIAGVIFAALGSSHIIPKTWEHGWDNKIVGMKDNTAYVVSRHHVDESDRYYYMVDYGGGRYKSHWVSQNMSDIYEVDTGPYVVRTMVQYRDPHNWFQADLTRFVRVLRSDSDLDHKWEFRVPKGSVVQEFKLDME
jgi:hypothetical protein